MKALWLAAGAGVTLWRDGDGIGYDGEMTGELADTIIAERGALLAVLPTERVVTMEAQALRDGWTRDAGGWHFPASWPRTLLDPPATLPRLTVEQGAQIRTPRTALPPGVAYGQDDEGRWRRLR